MSLLNYIMTLSVDRGLIEISEGFSKLNAKSREFSVMLVIVQENGLSLSSLRRLYSD
jgi:hypothetical protein